jgi:putative PIN family toxin of toxin-antitoxin system
MTARPAIVDTNVFVAGLLTQSADAPTARVLDGMLAGAFPFLLSVELLAEYREVLLRPPIRQRHGLDEAEVDRLLADVAKEAMIRDPPASPVAPDAEDQHVWDLLAAHPHALLVTGDRRLLQNTPTGASVMSPAAFVKLQDLRAER